MELELTNLRGDYRIERRNVQLVHFAQRDAAIIPGLIRSNLPKNAARVAMDCARMAFCAVPDLRG